MKTLIQTTALSLTAILFIGCGKEIPVEASDPEKAEVVAIHRGYKYTYRYDCDGNIEKEGYETIDHPRRSIRIEPEAPLRIDDSSFQNLTTGDNSAVIANHTVFTIDMSPSAFNLRVDEGLNEIKYRFTFVDQSTEEGSRFINVTYSESYDDDPRRIDPKPEDCLPEGGDN